MDNFIVESMMFEHQIQCEIDQCFIEMHEYIFDENADIMLEEAQNKKEGIINKLIRKINEAIQKIRNWFSKLTKNNQEINRKIEKVEEQIKSNPEIGKQQTDNFDVSKFTDEVLKEYGRSNKKPKKDVKGTLKVLLDTCIYSTPALLLTVIAWTKHNNNERAIRKLEDELNWVNAQLKADAETKIQRDERDIREKMRKDEERQKREDDYKDFKRKTEREQEGLKIKLDEHERRLEAHYQSLTDLNQRVVGLSQALAIAQQEANKQIQVATTGKPSTTTTKHSGENTAPSTNGAPKTKEQKNEEEHLSQEEQAKRIYTNYLDTIIKVWGNGVTRNDVVNLANSVKSDNEVVEKLKNINPKPSNPNRIPEMIMILNKKASDYNKLKNGDGRKKS